MNHAATTEVSGTGPRAVAPLVVLATLLLAGIVLRSGGEWSDASRTADRTARMSAALSHSADNPAPRLPRVPDRATPSDDLSSTAQLEALAADPGRCVAIGQRLMAQHPDRAADIGTILIGALVRANAHDAALRLARSGPVAEQGAWLEAIFCHWIANTGDRVAVMNAAGATVPASIPTVARSWAAVAPAEVARYSQQLPAGEVRQSVLSAAVNEWVLRNPSAVLAWIHDLVDDAEFDYALSEIVLHSDALVMPARQAVEFASSIQDVRLRAIVLRHALEVWLRESPEAAGSSASAAPPRSAD